jgi:DNA-binding response OmpR family regulator
MADQTDPPRSILIVDGDVLVRHAIADYLRDCGYIVIEAASTDEAKIVLNDANLGLDAVLADAETTGSINAFQLRTWAAEHRRNVQIVLAGT